MPVTVGPYGQSQPSCFDRVKMGFVMGFAVGMAAGALFGTFSCLRCGGAGVRCALRDRGGWKRASAGPGCGALLLGSSRWGVRRVIKRGESLVARKGGKFAQLGLIKLTKGRPILLRPCGTFERTAPCVPAG